MGSKFVGQEPNFMSENTGKLVDVGSLARKQVIWSTGLSYFKSFHISAVKQDSDIVGDNGNVIFQKGKDRQSYLSQRHFCVS